MSAEGVGAVLGTLRDIEQRMRQQARDCLDAMHPDRASIYSTQTGGALEDYADELADALEALAGQAEAGAGAEMPTRAELDAVRGYLIDVRSGSHTMGNLRHFANRHEHGHPSDIPEHWVGTPDDAHVTKAMHAHVLWRAFRRARLAALAPADAPAAQDGAGGREVAATPSEQATSGCHAGRDGDCIWKGCPQNHPSTRLSHCPLPHWSDSDEW